MLNSQLQHQLTAIKKGRPELASVGEAIHLTQELEIKNKQIANLEHIINEETGPLLAKVEGEIQKYKDQIKQQQQQIIELEQSKSEVCHQREYS